MDVATKQYLRDDRTSDCRSMCSNYRPSSQSRKMSIGILVDSIVKKTIGNGNKDDAAARIVERENSNEGNSGNGKNKEEQVKAAIKRKDLEQVGSPWISTKSYQRETPASENTFQAKENSLSIGRDKKKKLNGLKDTLTPSVQFFGNQTSIIQPADTNLKKFAGIAYKGNTKQDNSEKENGFAFPTAQENVGPEKQVTANKTETLKLKLWEVLGNVASPKSKPSDSQAPETAADKLKPAKIGDKKLDISRQNSDPIETDSENPDQKLKRPLTRSSTRNRVPAKRQSVKSKTGLSSSPKQKHHEKNKITSKEEWLSKIDGANKCGSTLPARRRSQRKSSAIAARKISFTEKESSDKNEQTVNGSQASPSVGKTSSQHKKVGDTLIGEKTKHSDTKSKIEDNSLHQSPVRKTNQQDEFFSPVLPENHKHQQGSHSSFENMVDPLDNYQSPTFRINTPISTPGSSTTPKANLTEHSVSSPSIGKRYTIENFRNFKSSEDQEQQEGIRPSSFENTVDPQENYQSPAIGINTPISSSGLSPTPEANKMKCGVCSPVTERRFTMENICSFKNLQTAKSNSFRSSKEPDSSDDEEELKDSPFTKPTHTNERKDTETGLPESSSEEEDSESSEEGSPVIKGHRGREATPEVVISRKSEFSLRPNKRLRQDENTEINEFTPPWPSSKGIKEGVWNHEPSEQTEEGDLTRVVTLLSLALENFKKKMNLAAQKKSSEILISASEGMQSQLQEKLATFSKSKRKRMESKFQEHQQQLKLIHEKFKEDLQQHLQDCKGTLEGLEGHRIELKETAKKQKASHQELLSHVEESVESQLSDAERRIRSVHKASFFCALK
ncbi:hypothetical protein ACFE04_016477 [Oxalis oulophora]